MFLTFSDVVFSIQPNDLYLVYSASHGNNYNVWREKLEIALALSDNDLALISPCPTKPEDPVRVETETDAAFAAR
jgi:hypothetical protein